MTLSTPLICKASAYSCKFWFSSNPWKNSIKGAKWASPFNTQSMDHLSRQLENSWVKSWVEPTVGPLYWNLNCSNWNKINGPSPYLCPKLQYKKCPTHTWTLVIFHSNRKRTLAKFHLNRKSGPNQISL